MKKGVGAMRKLCAAALAVLVLLGISMGVSAASNVSGAECQAAVSTDGSCQMVLSLTLHLEQVPEELNFPLPGSARDIRVNGSGVRTFRSGENVLVDLKRVVGDIAGNFALTLTYSLSGLAGYDQQEKLMLELPLLSGFSLPIQQMSFRIQLPGEVTGQPVFSSGYFQSSIETYMSVTVNGSSISGTVNTALQDHETLLMSLPVSQEMFPTPRPRQDTVTGYVETAAYVLGGAALLYYLFFLRFLPWRRVKQVRPPEGLTAGHLSAALTGEGVDLTLMVFTWAQLGYILIYLEEDGRVTLHKRMGMGNERSAFEQKYFRALFGERKMVSATSQTYAQLWMKVAAQENPQLWLRKRSGSKRVLRSLSALMGVFGGFVIGYTLVSGAWLGSVLAVLFAIAGGISAWHIQGLTRCILRPERTKMALGAALSLAWLLLGGISGRLMAACIVVGAQLLTGWLLAFAGRRTGSGRLAAAQAMGLRKYMRTLGRGEAQRLSRMNPVFFFDLIPYALALGVDKTFARQFGGMRLPGCPYLTTGMDGHMTAGEWARWMRETAQDMDSAHKAMPYERGRRILEALTTPPHRSRPGRRKRPPQGERRSAPVEKKRSSAQQRVQKRRR